MFSLASQSDCTLKRKAFSLLELSVAIVLLTSVLVMVGRFSRQVHQGIRDRLFFQQLQWELVNVKETVDSWPLSDVTEEKIENLPLSDTITNDIGEARWQATISSTPDLAAVAPETLSVTIELMGNYRGQDIKPTRLTFWKSGQHSAKNVGENRGQSEANNIDPTVDSEGIVNQSERSQ